MSEAAACYHETVNERSKVKNSAYHRVGGKAVTKLGNRRMTDKEINSKHGPVIRYDPNRFLTWDEFYALSLDLQVDYLNKLQDKYDIGIYQINRILFQKQDKEFLRNHLRIKGIIGRCNLDKKRYKSGINQFEKDIQAQRDRDRFSDVIDFTTQQPIEPVVKASIDDIPEFITYDKYMELSDPQKVLFINRLLNKYGVGLSAIDITLFEKCNGTLRQYFKKRDLFKDISTPMLKGNTEIRSDRKTVFVNAVNAWKGLPPRKPIVKDIPKAVEAKSVIEAEITPVEEKEVSMSETTEPSKASVLVPKVPVYMSSSTSVFTMCEEMDGIDVKRFEALSMLFKDKHVRVSVMVETL